MLHPIDEIGNIINYARLINIFDTFKYILILPLGTWQIKNAFYQKLIETVTKNKQTTRITLNTQIITLQYKIFDFCAFNCVLHQWHIKESLECDACINIENLHHFCYCPDTVQFDLNLRTGSNLLFQ